jgi:hypothetical protein
MHDLYLSILKPSDIHIALSIYNHRAQKLEEIFLNTATGDISSFSVHRRRPFSEGARSLVYKQHGYRWHVIAVSTTSTRFLAISDYIFLPPAHRALLIRALCGFRISTYQTRQSLLALDHQNVRRAPGRN